MTGKWLRAVESRARGTSRVHAESRIVTLRKTWSLLLGQKKEKGRAVGRL